MPIIKKTEDIIPSQRGLTDEEFATANPSAPVGEDEPIPAVAEEPVAAVNVLPDDHQGISPMAPPSPEVFALANPDAYVSIIESGAGYLNIRKASGAYRVSGGTLAWRNNNPGNMVYGSIAAKFGAIGKDYKGLAVFPTYDQGAQAQKFLLFDPSSVYYNLTLQDAIAKYAPASDGNDPKEYAVYVSTKAGINRDTFLFKLTPVQQDAMIQAMRTMEGFAVGEIHPIA